jgi:hypothetical protein
MSAWINRLAERTIASLSVWTSYEQLHEFTFRSAHGDFVRRGPPGSSGAATPVTVLWWLPAGETPTLDRALARLEHRRRFEPTGRPVAPRRSRPAAPHPAR